MIATGIGPRCPHSCRVDMWCRTSGRDTQYEKIGTWHIEQLAYLIDRMRSLREGDTTLLDNSMVFFGTTIRDGNKHDTEDLPLILAGRGGGGIRTGRRLTAPERTPLCNLYRTMMRRMGVPVDQFGTTPCVKSI